MRLCIFTITFILPCLCTFWHAIPDVYVWRRLCTSFHSALCWPNSRAGQTAEQQFTLPGSSSPLKRLKGYYLLMQAMPLTLNRQAALHNIQKLCPAIATILINTYRDSTQLFVDGCTLFSQEGTTQGDHLAMPMYAIATLPLTHRLNDPDSSTSQLWYADDATGTGSLSHLRSWWDRFISIGPAYMATMPIHLRPGWSPKKSTSLMQSRPSKTRM